MDKNILSQYEDACALIKETEDDIKALKKKKEIVHDSVRGSMNEHPYTAQSFHISGTGEDPEDRSLLDLEYKLLEERKANAEIIKKDVEAYINTVPVRMQRIIRLKLIKRKTWDEVALIMGKNCTADSIRMEFKRFLEEN